MCGPVFSHSAGCGTVQACNIRFLERQSLAGLGIPLALPCHVLRHLRLRMNYTTVYVTTSDAIVDTHKHAMCGGGFSEFTLFLKALLKKGGLAAIPRGPHAPSKKGSADG